MFFESWKLVIIEWKVKTKTTSVEEGGQDNGMLSRKSLILQCSSKKVTEKPTENHKSKVEPSEESSVSWKTGFIKYVCHAVLSHWRGTVHGKLGLSPKKKMVLRAQQLGLLVNKCFLQWVIRGNIFIVNMPNFLRIQTVLCYLPKSCRMAGKMLFLTVLNFQRLYKG